MPAATLLFVAALGVGAAMPAQSRMSVDPAERRVLLMAEPLTPVVYERRDGRWSRVAFARGPEFARGAVLTRDGVLAYNQLRPLLDGRIVPEATPVVALEGVHPLATMVSENLVLIVDADPGFRARLLRRSEAALPLVATIDSDHGLNPTAVDSSIGFDERRVAVLRDDHVTGCSVMIFEAADGRWSQADALEPAECRPPEDAPEPAKWNVKSIAVGGDRIALGLVRAGEGFGGEAVVVYRKGKDGWKGSEPVTRTDPEPLPEGMIRYGFGHRIVFDGDRMFVGDGYGAPAGPGSISYVRNGVAILRERGVDWIYEKSFQHTTRGASFGTEFVVQGGRLYIDSLDESAAYVFERRDGEWSMRERIPAVADGKPDTNGAKSASD